LLEAWALPADTEAMSRRSGSNEDGFLMLELVVTMAVMSIALMAMITVFTSGMFSMRRASQTTTASFLADAQMEAYRAMTYRDIGLDLSAGTVNALDTTYKNDTACANPPPPGTATTTCAVNGVSSTETGPTGSSPNSCTTINGWYSNTLPCTPSRVVSSSSTPASPDGRSYRVDTYIVQVAAAGLLRSEKQVTVVVRDGATLKTLDRETATFDCSTGAVPTNTADC